MFSGNKTINGITQVSEKKPNSMNILNSPGICDPTYIYFSLHIYVTPPISTVKSSYLLTQPISSYP